ncbi:MAG: hypothetical protein M3Q83_05460 [Pseudomonadota bacterium]|nr:hypothetical protein [Pseudomonadota bacterium]
MPRLTLAVVAASLVAGAAPPPPSAQPLTRAAFIATMDGQYRVIDGNKDGIVTSAEIDQHQQRLAIGSATSRARASFARIDTDRNGQVSPDEFVRANLASLKKADSAAILTRLDTNRDKRVTLVEYRVLTLAGFDRIDADKDGVLTAAEQRASLLAR